MDERKETSIVHSDDNMVLAKGDQYYVSVVKVGQQRNKKNNYVVIIHNEVIKGEQREVLAKKFGTPSDLMKFLFSIIPEYFIEQKVINETYNFIQKLISK